MIRKRFSEKTMFDSGGLTQWEENSYKQFVNRKERELDPRRKAAYFELYLFGLTPTEISKYKNESLGAIVEAYKNDNWPKMKKENLTQLYDGIRDKVKHVQTESIDFAANLLMAANRVHGKKILEYMATGNPAVAPMAIQTLKQYTEAVALLMKVTGQDQQKKVQMDHTISVTNPGEGALGSEKLTPQQAAAIMLGLAQTEDPPEVEETPGVIDIDDIPIE